MSERPINTNDLRDYAQLILNAASELDATRTERNIARRALDDAQARVKRQGEALEWQPIETAPKDGSSILVACKNGAIYAVWWCTVSDPAFDLEPCWCVTGGDDLARKGNDARTPTHWRPLPAYPARAALKETTDD